MKIITNNPLVHAEFPQKAELFDTDVTDILLKAKNYIDLGAELLSCNLTGDNSSGENPYRSIVVLELEKHIAMTTDFYSLTLIEDAIKESKASSGGFAGYDENALKDFQATDLELLKGCLEKLN